MTQDDGDAAYRCWLFNQFQQAVAHEVVPAINAEIRRRRAAANPRGMQAYAAGR